MAKNKNQGKGGNNKPARKKKNRSILDMVRGIGAGNTDAKRPIFDRIYGIGRSGRRKGGFSAKALYSGGIVLPAHHGTSIGHKGPMCHG